MSDAATHFPLAMLADDVTGGCDAGVQFSLRGAATRVYLDLPQSPAAFAGVSVIVNHSRGDAPEEASRKVEQACDWIAASGAKLCYKKIDSTLKGNVGPELEAMGVTIGAVTHSHYSISADIECSGENGHISSLPMLRRRNALVGAARLIAEIDRIGRAAAPAGSASAVVIDAWPNNRINIPHRAVFSYGIIHPDAEGLERMQAEIDAATQMVAGETDLQFSTLVARRRDPVHFTEELVALAELSAQELGLSVTRMRTRPGHDAFNMLRVCPTELIFVPCRDGISHNELEYCSPEHVAAGANVLLQSVLRRANR